MLAWTIVLKLGNDVSTDLDAIWVRPGCDLGAIWVRPGCDLDATWMRPGCDLDAIWVRPGCDLDAIWMRPGCDLDATWVRPGCDLDATWMRPGYYSHLAAKRFCHALEGMMMGGRPGVGVMFETLVSDTRSELGCQSPRLICRSCVFTATPIWSKRSDISISTLLGSREIGRW
jgi:hypothetical protein